MHLIMRKKARLKHTMLDTQRSYVDEPESWRNNLTFDLNSIIANSLSTTIKMYNLMRLPGT